MRTQAREKFVTRTPLKRVRDLSHYDNTTLLPVRAKHRRRDYQALPIPRCRPVAAT